MAPLSGARWRLNTERKCSSLVASRRGALKEQGFTVPSPRLSGRPVMRVLIYTCHRRQRGHAGLPRRGDLNGCSRGLTLPGRAARLCAAIRWRRPDPIAAVRRSHLALAACPATCLVSRRDFEVRTVFLARGSPMDRHRRPAGAGYLLLRKRIAHRTLPRGASFIYGTPPHPKLIECGVSAG